MASTATRSNQACEAGAIAAVTSLFEAFNLRDRDIVGRTLHYPHVLLGFDGVMSITRSPSDLNIDFGELKRREGWDHSVLGAVEVLQSSPDRVHLDVQFTRHKVDGTPYALFPGLWIVTLRSSRWGTQVRSYCRPRRILYGALVEA